MDQPLSPQALVLPYALRSVDRLVELVQGESPERLLRRPAVGASSLATLAAHTISNAEDNILGTLAGEPIVYDRERDFDAPPATAEALRVRWLDVRSRIEAATPALVALPWDQLVRHPRRGDVRVLEVFIVVARHAAEHLAEAELTNGALLGR